MKKSPQNPDNLLKEAARCYLEAHYPLALTGAGMSVDSGIPDFRSPGGLWTLYSPDEYGTYEAFLKSPEKAWRLYRELGRTLIGKKPNDAHYALKDLEHAGLLKGIITQNIDGLHEEAGSREVLLIHGNMQHLHCISCGRIVPFDASHLDGDLPRCSLCGEILKPTMVLFGEKVKEIKRIDILIERCDALIVIAALAEHAVEVRVGVDEISPGVDTDDHSQSRTIGKSRGCREPGC
jgi:NAD-dependent deacetylase